MTALGITGVEKLLKTCPLQPQQRDENLENVGSFIQPVARIRVEELADFLSQLGPQGGQVLAVVEHADGSRPSFRLNDLGDPVAHEFADAAHFTGFHRDILTDMSDAVADPVDIGQRIVSVLEVGRRTATYKLATLTALIDYCIEHLPSDPGEQLAVPIRDLGERVLEIYWHQTRPFETGELRQTSGSSARILVAARRLREAVGAGQRQLPLDAARLRAPSQYATALDDVTITLARQPLHRLQRSHDNDAPFLYDDSWLHDHLSRKQLREHGDEILLFGGVAHALARLAGLLKPTLEILWVEDVRRLNNELMAEVPDIAGHLFGRERTQLAVVREGLADAFGAQCFYCAARPRDFHVDHVLPWSRVGIDGLCNLVLACATCNGDKREALPAPPLVGRALDRDTATLDALATELAWPTQRPRVIAAASGLYRSTPPGTPLWAGYRSRVALDISWPPPWWTPLSPELS